MSLRVHIGETGEVAQRPEVLPEITDGAFDFSFLPGRSDMTGTRNEVVLTRECEKTRLETDERIVVFGNNGGEVVVPQLASDAAHRIDRALSRSEAAAARDRGASGNDASRCIDDAERDSRTDGFSSRRGSSSRNRDSRSNASLHRSAAAPASHNTAACRQKLQSAFHHRRFRDSAF